MREDKLQHNFIMWFGQTWPEYNDLIFEVNNNPKNQIHGTYRKSMGMKKNVSDLILIRPNSGEVIGIELKAPGSVWPKDHIENQFNWGKLVIKNGGLYIMTSCLDTLKDFVTCIMINDILSVIEIMHEQLKFVENQFTNKTIKF